MMELRFVSVSEDGQHLVVSAPELDDEAFLLPLSDELRDAVSAPPAVPERPAPTYGEPLSPREIQARVRAGESAEQIAQASGMPLVKVERFAGPVLSERAHMTDEARAARPAGQVDDASRTLGELVDARLGELGSDPAAAQWDGWRRDDGVWMIQLGYLAGGDRHTAEWTWDPGRRQLRSYGAAARALMAPPADDAVPAVEPEPAPGLRMVPVREPQPAAPPPSRSADEAAEADSQRKHPAGRARGRKEAPEEPDGVGRRAVVPSWDDIMFGIRRPDEGS